MNVNSPENRFRDPQTPFSDWMEAGKSWVEAELDLALPPADTPPEVLHTAMRYAATHGGKRLRALLALASCQALGGDPRRALRPALALELFHAYTLVHDDLPCMDDDDLRRGKPSTHIQFGEANALLAGDALLTLSLQWMAESVVPLPHPPNTLVLELATAGGSTGVIGGQVEDLAAESAPPDEDRLMRIHTEKTARLIACACRVGAVAAGACSARVDQLGAHGLHLGLAFQIMDDILDATQETAVLGKPAGSDAGNAKLTSVSIWSLEGARERAAHHTQKALRSLEGLEEPATRLEELTTFLLCRGF